MDPSDKYSIPTGVIKTKLATIYQMSFREKPEKPGRKLAVVWDSRFPLYKGFENRYSYIVTFASMNNLAGNHYHNKKNELFYPIVGDFKVILEDIQTKEREEIFLESSKNQVVHVKPKTAHVVISQSQTALLLVVASYPNNEEDEFEYILT